MILWIDAQLSPALAPWIKEHFGIDAVSARHLGFRDAADLTIFHAAREARVTVLTKDVDFSLLLARFGPPPSVLWIRCGNTSNAHLRQVLKDTFD